MPVFFYNFVVFLNIVLLTLIISNSGVDQSVNTKVVKETKVVKNLQISEIKTKQKNKTNNLEKKYTEADIKYKNINKKLLDKINCQFKYEKEENSIKINEDKIIMKEGRFYSKLEGITTFRGNNYRDSASYGFAKLEDKKLEVIWKVPIGYIDRWTGVGWNGQPAIIKWPDNMKQIMNIFKDKKVKKNLREVIYGALDGKIYFLDLDDGKSTRNPIKLPGPIKGSVTVDPRGIPLLYVGQGINKVNGKIVETGYRIYSLINQEKLFFINGVDPFAYRKWPAFDSTPLIDEKTDTLLLGGENGLFYKIKLNTQFNQKDTVKINPEVTKYRYKITENKYQGIENSVAIYRNLAYFADNGGWLQCIDINSLEPVWTRNLEDDTDSTIVIEEKNNNVFIYTACEVDKQGKRGKCYIRKIDGLSGQLIWEKTFEAYSKGSSNGGALATPVLGKINIDNLIIFNISRFKEINKGLLVALDKNTGEEVWRIEMDNYSWSSPVDVYTEKGEGYIIICDSIGDIFLIEGSSGKILDKINIGANVEGSPAVYEDIIVVGTRGQEIYGIKLK